MTILTQLSDRIKKAVPKAISKINQTNNIPNNARKFIIHRQLN
ncbi:hypothetical protein HU219_12620 [Staphylococcus sp. SS35]|nr:hypothetical protein [Staphylococcus singaporensis]